MAQLRRNAPHWHFVNVDQTVRERAREKFTAWIFRQFPSDVVFHLQYLDIFQKLLVVDDCQGCTVVIRKHHAWATSLCRTIRIVLGCWVCLDYAGKCCSRAMLTMSLA